MIIVGILNGILRIIRTGALWRDLPVLWPQVDGCRSVLPLAQDRSPNPKSQALGITRRHQPGPPVATAGQRQEAYELLQPVYGWFTEGFDAADLREAKNLLVALG